MTSELLMDDLAHTLWQQPDPDELIVHDLADLGGRQVVGVVANRALSFCDRIRGPDERGPERSANDGPAACGLTGPPSGICRRASGLVASVAKLVFGSLRIIHWLASIPRSSSSRQCTPRSTVQLDGDRCKPRPTRSPDSG